MFRKVRREQKQDYYSQCVTQELLKKHLKRAKINLILNLKKSTHTHVLKNVKKHAIKTHAKCRRKKLEKNRQNILK